MSKVTASYDFDRLPEDEVVRYLSIWAEQVSRVINGDIGIADNLKVAIKEVTFTAANTDTAIQTGLNYIANYYIQLNSTVDALVYNGSRDNQVGVLYLKTTQAGTATILIF